MNEEQIKKRLIGSIVVVLTLVIVIPILLDSSEHDLRKVEIEEVPSKSSFETEGLSKKLFGGGVSESYINMKKGSSALDLQANGDQGGSELEEGPEKVLDEIMQDDENVNVAETFENSLEKLETEIGDRLKRKGAVEGKPQVLIEWLVQVGSFSDLKNAERLVSQLKEDSFRAVALERGDVKGGSYKVRVGPYKNKSNAHKALLEIEKKHTVSGFLVKVSP